MKMKTKQLGFSIILLSIGMAHTASVCAQQEYPRIIKRIPAEQEFLHIDDNLKLGNFIFKPKIGFTEYYDSNIFATDVNEESDSVSMLKANLLLDSDWQSHSLGFELGLDAARYAEFDTENTVDNWLTARGTYDATKDIQLFADASTIRDHEDRASPDEVYGTEPTEFSENRFNAAYRQKLNQHSLSLALNSTEYDFDDVSTSIGTIDNDSRDHTISGYGLRFNYALSKAYSVFIQASSDNRDYELPMDINGFNRDSEGAAYALGFKFNQSYRLQGEVFVGHLSQDYDDVQFNNLSEPDFGAQARWFASPDIVLNLIIDRSLEETTIDGASSFLYTQYALRADHRITPQWFFNLNASRGNADYQTLSRKDTYTDLGIGISFSLVEGLSFDADYRLMERDSSEPTDAYSRNQILFSVSARL